MIQFTDENVEHIGRVDVLELVIINDGVIENTPGRPGFDPLFMARLTFSSSSKHCMDEVPTGMPTPPPPEEGCECDGPCPHCGQHHPPQPQPKYPTMVPSPEEFILTDADGIWLSARHRNPDGQEPDPQLHIMEDDELPARLKVLSKKDRSHIIRKIAAWAEEMAQNNKAGGLF